MRLEEGIIHCLVKPALLLLVELIVRWHERWIYEMLQAHGFKVVSKAIPELGPEAFVTELLEVTTTRSIGFVP